MIRRILWVLVALSVSVAAAASEPQEDLPRFSDSVQVIDDGPILFPVDFDRKVLVRFPVGELDIIAGDVAEVRTDLRVRCKKLSEALCTKYRSKLRLEARDRDGQVEVRLVGLPRWKLRKLNLDGEVTFPRWAPLDVRMGIGDIDIYAGEKDLNVRMGIGDLTVRVPEAQVGTVRAATRIGDASIRGANRAIGKRRMLIGASVDWSEGTGPMNIALGLRIGDASVVLE